MVIKEEEEEKQRLEELAKTLDDPKQSMIDKFIDDEAFRKKMLKI